MKKIVVINGHPDPESYCYALQQAYVDGARQNGFEVEEIFVGELDFQLSLTFGYRKRVDLEPDLVNAQAKIRQADHLVFIFPLWWGGYPAILKGFFDRTFLPGFAFQKRENSLWWDKLLVGRSARIIVTADQPGWYYRFVNGRPTYHAMKKMTLQFCGISKVRSTFIGPVRNSSDRFREKWLRKVQALGRKGL